MIESLTVSQFLEYAVSVPVLDVRSPAEYEQGHIPGAISFPLFSNEERAAVGTLYKQKGKEEAVLHGLELVGPKMPGFVRQAGELAPNRQVLVYCWRGGMRSGSMAWLLQTAGFQIHTLVGGYKAFRHSVLNELPVPPVLLVLGGFTGSRKTEILHQLHERGSAILDLELLANHRGSAFGGTGTPQPTNEHFENRIFSSLFYLKNEPVVWVEDESNPVGRVHIQKILFERMRQSPVAFLDRALASRVKHLTALYGELPVEKLEESFLKITRRLGNDGVKKALQSLAVGDLETAASIALTYYDKTYQYGLGQRNQDLVVHFSESDENNLTEALKKWEATFKP